MFLGKLIEITLHHLRHQILETRRIPAVDLQQETLLQRTGSDARRIERLQQLKNLQKFLFRHINIMIYGQFVTDSTKILSEKTIILQ